MGMFGTILKAVAAGMVGVTAAVIVLEIKIFYDKDSPDNGRRNAADTAGSWKVNSAPRSDHLAGDHRYQDDLILNSKLSEPLPNQARLKWKDQARISELRNEVGTRSVHNGAHQRERQLWLKARAEDIRDGYNGMAGRRNEGNGSRGGKAADETRESASSSSSAAKAKAAAARSRSRSLGSVDNEEGVRPARATKTVTTAAVEPVVEVAERSPILVDKRGSSRNSSRSNDNSHKPSLKERRGEELVVNPPSATARDQDAGRASPAAAAAAAAATTTERNRSLEGGRQDEGRKLRGVSTKRPIIAADAADAADAGVVVVELPLEERLSRLEAGAELWGGTFVPPIAPDEKQRLVERWSASAAAAAGGGNATAKPAAVGAPRILFVVTSFDRGTRVAATKDIDKLDYVLMIMDEIRETCEAGFSPHAHLISAWDVRPELELFFDRLFCRRIGGPVPLTLKEYPPDIKEVLSIKHRMYMKPRVGEFDLFIQLEDDMILTVNHVLRYLEESEKISRRMGEVSTPRHDIMPGFMRVEPKRGETGVGGEWYEWEIILSRFRGVHVVGAGTYLALDRSRVMAYQGNNQGFWMATREQLQYLDRKCRYLRYTEESNFPFVEKFSGSLEMFSPNCQSTKVFPATHFEDFMVHHRTNNKNGKRGESHPAVSISMLRFWASQMLRDDEMLMEIGGGDSPP